MRNYASLITLLLSISSLCMINTTIVVVHAQNDCKVIGYKMYLATGYEEEYLLSGRSEVETLNEGYYICSEQVGDNIEAIMNPECDLSTLNAGGGSMSGISLQIYSISDTGAQTYFGGGTETTAPYFTFGNVGTTVLGRVMPPGKYRIVGFPKSNNRAGRLRMNFQVVTCMNYLPKNECHNCPVWLNSLMPILPTTCAGTQCVTTSPKGIRFVLLSYGQDTYDYGMNITSPKGSTLNVFNNNTARTNYLTTDSVTGGYVDVDYIDTSCRSTGVWMKNIVYPTYISGIYSITIQDVLKCTFAGGPPPFMGGGGAAIKPPPNQNRFEIRVFKHERLVQTVNDISVNAIGKVYTFTL